MGNKVNFIRHVTFPVFTGTPVFWIFFAEKSITEIHVLFTFVLLNRGVPGVETIYFVSIEQNK